MPLAPFAWSSSIAVLALVAAGCASTSESAKHTSATPVSDRGEAFDIAKLDGVPVPVFQARPIYPAALSKSRAAGEAVVDFVIDVSGNVRNAYAIRATHTEFGVAAVEAVEKWKFRPGMKGGRPVNTHMQVPIVFTLSEDPVPTLAAGAALQPPATPLPENTYDISKLDVAPVARYQARPHYPVTLRQTGVAGEAVVDFVVDREGNVQRAFATRATHPAFADVAVAAVSSWRFKAGMKDGETVNTHMQVPVVFTLSRQ